MGRIILISGGTSSGKSRFAEDYCMGLDKRTAYLATSIIFDEEMEIKKNKHIERRKKNNWDTIEVYTDIDKLIEKESFDYDVVLLDCITMYISNLMFYEDTLFEARNLVEKEKKREYIVEKIKSMLKSMSNKGTHFIIVTNEIGLGVLPGNELSRFFAEISGEVNQIISEIAEEVYFVVSGISMRIK